MKKINFNKSYTFLIAFIAIVFSGCNDEQIWDFGYNGELSGKIVDLDGNIISGDIKTASFAVNAKGELDVVSMVMRIRGDGTYANTKLYPQSYDVWLEGPFLQGPTQPVTIDLTGGKKVVHDFQVTPLLNLPAPTLVGSPTSTEIKVNYKVVGNSGNIPDLIEIYCSTVVWPTRTTGSGYNYSTQTVTVDEIEGTATINNLEPDTKYFIRVGARAAGQSLFNHSVQLTVTTP